MNRNTNIVLKKAVNLILLLAFFLTLTACAGKDTNDGKAANKEDTNQENTVQPEKEESDVCQSQVSNREVPLETWNLWPSDLAIQDMEHVLHKTFPSFRKCA